MPEDVLVTICELHVASSVAKVHNYNIITVAVSTDENQEKCSYFFLYLTLVIKNVIILTNVSTATRLSSSMA